MSGPRDNYVTAMAELTKALEEWKNAGGDVLQVVGAIQRFVFVLLEEARERQAILDREPGG